MENTKIGWSDHTWNPWWGCNKVSDACTHCYIGPIMRFAGYEPFRGPIRTSEVTWINASKWNRNACRDGKRMRVFTCSMSDFFHRQADAWRDEAWKVIRSCDQLDFLILTKRPELIADRLPDDWGSGYPNVWLGVTVESQKQIHRLDLLSKVPSKVRFVSAEPLLGPLRFGRRIRKLDWVITGSERAAKRKRRTMDLGWVRGIRDECDAAGVPLFHKQYYRGTTLVFDGILDGEQRQDFPVPQA